MSKLLNFLSKKAHFKRKKYTVVLNGRHMGAGASISSAAGNSNNYKGLQVFIKVKKH
jgi:hypothetical protein